jgi:hypothetical protein
LIPKGKYSRFVERQMEKETAFDCLLIIMKELRLISPITKFNAQLGKECLSGRWVFKKHE